VDISAHECIHLVTAGSNSGDVIQRQSWEGQAGRLRKRRTGRRSGVH
jgi:hypothetical protein